MKVLSYGPALRSFAKEGVHSDVGELCFASRSVHNRGHDSRERTTLLGKQFVAAWEAHPSHALIVSLAPPVLSLPREGSF